MRRYLLLALAPLAVAATACGDNLGLGTPLIASDSAVVLAVPGSPADLASAIDFTQVALRRPERIEDATAWDFALRQEGSTLRLIPSPFDTPTRRPIIFRSTQAFDAIERAPTTRSAYGDTAVTLQTGGVYVARSRYFPTAGGGFCYAFAKLRVEALDPVAGTARFRVKANVGCADDRLEAD